MRARWSAVLWLLLAMGCAAPANEPLLRRGDIVAFVGGEEMLALSEAGELEWWLVRALPDYQLRFRDLAWEGDTVFEQHRDLNYPTVAQQLDTIGATVVIAQFGQMESLAGPAGVAGFVDALEKLADRLSAKGKRRLVLVAPTGFEVTAIAPKILRNSEIESYRDAIRQLAKRRDFLYAESPELRRLLELPAPAAPATPAKASGLPEQPVITRDGIHLRPRWLKVRAESIATAVLRTELNAPGKQRAAESELRTLIAAKNRFWFHYRRPQNWAFLAGDRVSQPSSRDYRDPSKRWFPGEMEQFLPRIAAKETEIWKMAEALR